MRKLVTGERGSTQRRLAAGCVMHVVTMTLEKGSLPVKAKRNKNSYSL
jgi:hypothetical protein